MARSSTWLRFGKQMRPSCYSPLFPCWRRQLKALLRSKLATKARSKESMECSKQTDDLPRRAKPSGAQHRSVQTHSGVRRWNLGEGRPVESKEKQAPALAVSACSVTWPVRVGARKYTTFGRGRYSFKTPKCDTPPSATGPFRRFGQICPRLTIYISRLLPVAPPSA